MLLAAMVHHGKAKAAIHVVISREFSGPKRTCRFAKAWNTMKIQLSGNDHRIFNGGYCIQVKNLGRYVSPSQDTGSIFGMAFPKVFLLLHFPSRSI